MDFLTYDTIIIGTGAAGYNAAVSLRKLSNKSLCIVTEGISCGTSRNTGSDKQTYYKLSLGGSTDDSVRKMAENLFAGGAVDGDNALCEAALSINCFFNLCSLGVPFPVNRYGEYVGYKTDHDPYARATSAGPLTSKFMTEALEKEASRLEIPVFDKLLAVEILKEKNRVAGLLCLDKTNGNYKIFRCNNIILATGGPAGIYKNTVYPDSHTGSTGLAIRAGAALQNMTEWQYGLSSIHPKWNVSGTYMQVLPVFFSEDAVGNRYEFLTDYIPDIYEALSMVFLKGYQWPFDSRKASEGSSRIDLAVYNETVIKKRRVFLDFTKNPFGLINPDFSLLSEEAYSYLKNADALSGTPIERLEKMNAPAIVLYKSKGVDLYNEPLEISLSAQHNNGGIAVDLWWQSNISGLFAAGECAGTHGITRPGGSALNAGQTGSLRAAQFISIKEENYIPEAEFIICAKKALEWHKNFKDTVLSDKNTADALLNKAREDMSECAAAVRNAEKISVLYSITQDRINSFLYNVKATDTASLITAYKYFDTLFTQCAVLAAIKNYRESTCVTRGSAVYTDNIVSADSSDKRDVIQEIQAINGNINIKWRSVRPVPCDDDFFENVWRRYREDKNIF